MRQTEVSPLKTYTFNIYVKEANHLHVSVQTQVGRGLKTTTTKIRLEAGLPVISIQTRCQILFAGIDAWSDMAGRDTPIKKILTAILQSHNFLTLHICGITSNREKEHEDGCTLESSRGEIMKLLVNFGEDPLG